MKAVGAPKGGLEVQPGARVKPASCEALEPLRGAIYHLLASSSERRAAEEFLLVHVSLPSRPLAISTLRTFSGWTRREGLSLHDLRARDMARFIETYPAEASRRRGVLSLLSAFFSHLERSGVMDRNPAASVLKPRNPYPHHGVTPALSEGECERLLSAAGQRGGVVSLRDVCLIRLLRETMGRLGAVCGAKVSDLRWHGEGRYLRLQEKASRIEMKALSPDLSRLIDEYLKASPPLSEGSFLFRSAAGRGAARLSERRLWPQNAREMIKKRGREAGLKGVHPHMLRVTGMNEFRRAGGTREEAQRLMGHGSEGMVIYYEREDKG